jgi:hypothetical protein
MTWQKHLLYLHCICTGICTWYHIDFTILFSFSADREDKKEKVYDPPLMPGGGPTAPRRTLESFFRFICTGLHSGKNPKEIQCLSAKKPVQMVFRSSALSRHRVHAAWRHGSCSRWG